MPKPNETQISEIRDMVATGDQKSADDFRADYALKFGTPSTLTDDDIYACCAAQDDDYGPDEILQRMAKLQASDANAAFCEGECVA